MATNSILNSPLWCCKHQDGDDMNCYGFVVIYFLCRKVKSDFFSSEIKLRLYSNYRSNTFIDGFQLFTSFSS